MILVLGGIPFVLLVLNLHNPMTSKTTSSALKTKVIQLLLKRLDCSSEEEEEEEDSMLVLTKSNIY